MANIKEQDQTITFHMIKSPSCQTHQVDGVIAGFTPSDGVFLEFYTERGAIPQSVTYKLAEDGTLGEVVGTTGKDGIVREIQTGVILDLDGLKSLNDRISSMIEQLEEGEE